VKTERWRLRSDLVFDSLPTVTFEQLVINSSSPSSDSLSLTHTLSLCLSLWLSLSQPLLSHTHSLSTSMAHRISLKLDRLIDAAQSAWKSTSPLMSSKSCPVNTISIPFVPKAGSRSDFHSKLNPSPSLLRTTTAARCAKER
jgi:hypothetical protein